jgi:serine/threonine protein kinase
MTDDPDRDPVDVLAEEFADRLRRGERPSVGDYAAAHPDHADQLRELLPAVAQMELLKRFRAPEPSLPDRLGDFRIVRELGRGGMGVVFEAVQESLGRPVALKVLARHAQLDPAHRERFRREAEAAARLHHTNIVPVFGVGEQDGLPYYVMQLIAGSGLHALVRKWRQEVGKGGEAAAETVALGPATKPAAQPPFEVVEPNEAAPRYGAWRFVAEVGRQAAEALGYAHRHGVLHRDVKPANLIFDGDAVWVADFGLAKLSAAASLTATGDILGTLQYLPPESLSGAADARSDVYGLGATLYELLTLEPPYAADTPAALVRRVTDTDPRPPRSLNPHIPRDLETIVLKAMAREPGSRYASARDLAADLAAFLDDRPIRARRLSAVARAWRVCRRNPVTASLALSTGLALVLAAAAGWAGYARAEERRKDAEKATAEAERATAEARDLSARLEANLRLSLETFEKVFEAAGGPGPPGFGGPLIRPIGFGGRGPGPPGKFDRIDIGPGGPKELPAGPPRGPGGPAGDLASDKAAILEAVLGFYDRFAEQNPPTPRLRFEAAKASRRVGEAHVLLNRPKDAAVAFARAIALLEPLVERFPDNEGMRAELVFAHLSAPGANPRDPEAGYRRAAELAAGRARLTGIVQTRAGAAAEQRGDPAAAVAAYAAAVESFNSNAAKPPHGDLELGFARWRLGWALFERGDRAGARGVLERSVAELTAAGAADRPGPARDLLGRTYAELARAHRALGDHPAAAEAEAKAGPFAKKDWPKKG